MTDTKFDFEYWAEQERRFEEEQRERRHIARANRRAMLVQLGDTRDQTVERIKQMLPAGTNPRWWEKLERWLERNPYREDDWDSLIEAARHPERYNDPDPVPEVKFGDQRGKHMRRRPKPEPHRQHIAEATKRSWEQNREARLEAVRRGHETRKRNAQLRREAEQAREDPY